MSVQDSNGRSQKYFPILVAAIAGNAMTMIVIIDGAMRLQGQFDQYVQAGEHALNYASRLGSEPRVDYVGPYKDKFYFSAWSSSLEGPVPTRHYLLCDPDGCEAAPPPVP